MEPEFQDLDELAKFALEGIRQKHFILMIGVEDAEATLTERAQRYGRAALPIDFAPIPQF